MPEAGKMDQTTKIRRAIADAMAVFSPFRDQSPDSRDVIDRDGAELIATAVFTSLESGGDLYPGPLVDRQIRIILAITEAIGHVGEPPHAYRPGKWMCHVTNSELDLSDVADSVYANLKHRGYLRLPPLVSG
jgi:hypothetical protein